MLKVLVLLILLCDACFVASAAEIRPIHSWAEFRERAISDGKSEAEADAQIVELLSSLRAMDRAAGDDLIGSAAPPFRFDT